MREVDEHVLVGERVGRWSRVSRVGAGGGIASTKRRRHRGIADRTGESAIAHDL